VDPTEAIPEIALMTVGEDSRTRISQRVTIDSQWVDLLIGDRMTLQETVYAHESQLYAHQTQLQLQGTLIQTQHQVVVTLCVMRDMRREMSDMQAELLVLREQQRRARQPGLDVRVLDHQDASRDADSHI
ncbi:hypothetical protein Tco_0112911, partial [Tanacetum coccineum]